MLQKWFNINSDPELENQISDRLSSKKFLSIPFSKSAPDHSTYSRFRSRLSKEAMDQINSEIIKQFKNQDLTINEGDAIDARLAWGVKSIFSFHCPKICLPSHQQ